MKSKKKNDDNTVRDQDRRKEELRNIKIQLGYSRMGGMYPYLKQPDVSVSEKIEEICKHLNIKIVKKPEEIRIIKTK